MHDPIADMLTRIRNGQQAKHQAVSMVSSIMKEQIASVLKAEGFINDFKVQAEENNLKTMVISLKYYQSRPVIDSIKRVSRPGLRIYKSVNDLKDVPGFGISILSTSQGVMTQKSAKAKGIGGELICEVA